jgi:hypothetical protein
MSPLEVRHSNTYEPIQLLYCELGTILPIDVFLFISSVRVVIDSHLPIGDLRHEN